MKTTTLGRSGLHVSRIAFGTWQLAGEWGRFDEDAAIAAIRRARELGVNFFDTAQAYGFGASDSGLVRDASPQWLRRGVDASLTTLGIDRIDLYQVHWPDPAVPTADTAGELADLVIEGKIGHVGVSNYTAAQIEEFSQTLPVETVQPPYHLFRREIEDDLLPFCRAHDIGVLVYGPLAHGLLTGTLTAHTMFDGDDWRGASSVFTGDIYRRNLSTVRALEKLAAARRMTVSQLAIAWTLANPGVHVAIVGARQARHVQDSVGATEVGLSAVDLAEIDTIIASATPIAGPSPESA